MIEPKDRSWLGLIFALRGSVLVKIWPRIVATTALSALVTWVHMALGWFPQSITLIPFSLVGLALSIFLGFRNTSSYDRFWEGRKLWGSLVNTSRTFARRVATFVERETGAGVDPRHAALVRRVIGFVHALRLHLREQSGPEQVLPFLPPDERDAIAKAHHAPAAILQAIGVDLTRLRRAGAVDPFHAPMLEATLTELTDILGACERIKSTPIPFGYIVLLHRLVAFYCFGLPFGIVDDTGVFTPLVVGMVSYAFMGLDAIGDETEDPFDLDANDIPLSRISRNIERDLLASLGETELPPPVEAVNGVIQ